jgi:hypothetical protein
VPVLFTWLKPDHIPRMNLLNRAVPTLHSTATGRHNQGLAQRMGVPGGAAPWFKGDTGPPTRAGSGALNR